MALYRLFLLGALAPRAGWLLAALLTVGSLTSALAAPTGPGAPADTVWRAGLRGQVINQQKQPLEFATVLLRRAGDSTLVGSLLSDEQGQRETQGLKPATIRLPK